jgi:uncharacterized membrane protein YgdD (TMEM256/DUF423 family)
MALFNQYSLSVMSVLFQIIGSFFLALEAFGAVWLDKFFNRFLTFSNWARKSLIRLLPITIAMMTPFFIAIKTQNKILISLLLPIGIFILLFSSLMDEARNLRYLTNVMINKKKITPIGFIMLLIGYILQLITTIIQMS